MHFSGICWKCRHAPTPMEGTEGGNSQDLPPGRKTLLLCRTLWTRSCGPQGNEKAESYNSTLNGSPKRGSPLDCALYCPCTTIIGGCWFFTALDLIPNVSHTRSADWWGATAISESLLAAEMPKLPVCAGDKHDTAPSIFQHCLCHVGNYWQTSSKLCSANASGVNLML